MTPAPSPRGTEFTDTRFSNGSILRNILKNYGIWIVHRSTKMTQRNGHLSWVPTLCPTEIAELLNWYLVVVRPVEVTISHVFGETEGISSLEEYLWVQNGKRVTSDRFSTMLANYTEQYMHASINLSTWRHLSIAIMREYTFSNTTMDNIADSVSNHTTGQARKTYAREYGSLPAITTDVLRDVRSFCDIYHNVLGVGSNPPPLPIQLVLRHTLNPGPHPSIAASDAASGSINMEAMAKLISSSVHSCMQDFQLKLEQSVQLQIVKGLGSIAEVISNNVKSQIEQTMVSSLRL